MSSALTDSLTRKSTPIRLARTDGDRMTLGDLATWTETLLATLPPETPVCVSLDDEGYCVMPLSEAEVCLVEPEPAADDPLDCMSRAVSDDDAGPDAVRSIVLWIAGEA